MRKKLVLWPVAKVLPFGDEIKTFATGRSILVIEHNFDLRNT